MKNRSFATNLTSGTLTTFVHPPTSENCILSNRSILNIKHYEGLRFIPCTGPKRQAQNVPSVSNSDAHRESNFEIGEKYAYLYEMACTRSCHGSKSILCLLPRWYATYITAATSRMVSGPNATNPTRITERKLK